MTDIQVIKRPGYELTCYFGLGAAIIAAYFSVLDFVPHLLIDTTLIIVLGTLQSTDTKASEIEIISTSDAAKFPFVASAALFGLYATYKYVPEEYIKPLVSFYFTAFGCFIMTALFKGLYECIKTLLTGQPVQGSICFYITETDPLFKIPFADQPLQIPYITMTVPTGEKAEGAVPVDTMDLFFFVCTLPLGYYYLAIEKFWIINNFMGISFCLQAIRTVRMGGFQAIAVLLVALFFYDIFWVFGTEVMVTVAKKFDAPIKLLFPRLDVDRPSLLGLGDIVIPAFLITMMARFDIHLQSKKDPKLTSTKVLSGNYFWVSLVSYFLGMSVTMTSMLYFEAAQPALLYLVPACLIGTCGFALLCGDMTELWNFKDGEEEPTEKEEDNKKDK